MHRDLVEEYEEWLRLEQFAKTQAKMKPEPKPEPVDPFKAYTQGSQGQLITDWKAFGRNYTPEQLVPHSTAPDIRDNRDPEQVWIEMVKRRDETNRLHGGFKVVDEIASGQLSFDTAIYEIDDNGPVSKLEEKICWSGSFHPHTSHIWTEDRPGGHTYYCPGVNEDAA